VTNPIVVHISTIPETLNFLKAHIQYAKKSGFDVHVISTGSEYLAEFSFREQVDAHRIDMERRVTPLRDIRSLTQLVRLLRKLRPAIVHSHTPKAGLIGMLAAKLARVPVQIHHLHGAPFLTTTGLERALLKASDFITCLCAHRVYVVSRSLLSLANSERLCSVGKARILGPGSIGGVDAICTFNPGLLSADVKKNTKLQLNIPGEAVVVGFIGRLAKDKGIGELFSAWRLLREEFQSAFLLIVGPDDPRDPISGDLHACLRQDSRIRMTGQVADLVPLYSVMDVFCLPSHREGFPVVCLEASAMALPVVTTRAVGCVDAVVDGVTGVLVECGSGISLAKALRDYLLDPKLRASSGNAGRNWVVENFRPDCISCALLKEYKDLLQGHGSR
jgi:glycosyltransferase involved in cell wall biosynthesis